MVKEMKMKKKGEIGWDQVRSGGSSGSRGGVDERVAQGAVVLQLFVVDWPACALTASHRKWERELKQKRSEAFLQSAVGVLRVRVWSSFVFHISFTNH